MTEPKLPVPATPVPRGPAPVGPEVLSQILAQQTRQLEIREKEIEVERYAAETERREADHAQTFSLRALEAQERDRKDEREHAGTTTKYGFRITLLVVIGIFGLCGYALVTDKDQLILELVKAILYAAGGGGVGFALGLRKARSSSEDPKPGNQ